MGLTSEVKLMLVDHHDRVLAARTLHLVAVSRHFSATVRPSACANTPAVPGSVRRKLGSMKPPALESKMPWAPKSRSASAGSCRFEGRSFLQWLISELAIPRGQLTDQ